MKKHKGNNDIYRLIAQNSAEGIYHFDNDGKFIFVNKAYCHILGYSKEELKGKNFSIIVPDRLKEQAKTNFVKHMSGEVIRGEFAVRHKDGHEIPVFFSATPIKKDEKIVGFAGTMLDITEQKEAEEKLKRTLKEKEELQKQLQIYNKKLEKKVSLLEKGQIPLTQNEQIILTALTTYPSYTDRELFAITNIKRSTITGIRNRLKKNRWFRKITMPNLQALGYDTLLFLEYNYTQNFKKNEINDLLVTLHQNQHCFHSQRSESFFFTLSAYTNIHNTTTEITRVLHSQTIPEQMSASRFFLPSSTLSSFFNFSLFLNELFNLPFKPLERLTPSFLKLSKNEKELLYLFTKYPNATIYKAKELTRLSEPTIIKIKKKLFTQGYLQSLIIPNMRKLGFSYMGLMQQSLTKPLHGKKPLFLKIAQEFPSLFSIVSEDKFVIVNIERDYDQLQNKFLKQKNMFQTMFKTLSSPFISTAQGYTNSLWDFAPLVKTALKLDVNY